MYHLLKKDKENESAILRNVLNRSIDYLHSLENGYVAPIFEQQTILTLPTDGLGAENTLDLFSKKYQDAIIKSTGPRYFGFVVGGATPASIAGDWLTSIYDQMAFGLHENVDYAIEKETVSLIRELIGLSDHYFGTFVTGATMANFVSLALARQWSANVLGVKASDDGLYGLNNIKVLSGNPHSSIYKSLSMLGMGRKSLVIIDQLPGREAVDVSQLQLYLENNPDQPIIVVANAGTVNTADFDDLSAIATLKEKYPFWLHVDAAFGGVAASSNKYKHLLQGLNEADSITMDAHKWLNVPYDSAVQFTKHKDLQYEIFYNGAPYIGGKSNNPPLLDLTPENSRRLRALPIWFSLLSYGKKGYEEIVERNCEIAEEFSKRIDESKYFKLLAPSTLNVVCFTFNINEDHINMDLINQLLHQIRTSGKAFLTPTNYKGIPAIRIAVSNWRTTIKDVDITWEYLIKYGREIVNKYTND